MSIPCFSAADILLPSAEEISKGLWSVIACDQFTSEPDYWHAAELLVGEAPSTLHLMLPEVWLGEAATRLPSIHRAMREMLKNTLILHPDSMIAVERVQADGRIRRGLVGKIDLEQYDYNKNATSLIRATEGTVLERIPPRVAIRRNAELELPHVMLLIDDPEKTVIEPLFKKNNGRQTAYDCKLMLGGGHLHGSYLTPNEQAHVASALEALMTSEAMAKRYGKASTQHAPLLFAVGDGNHSLASAKAAYEEIKASIGATAAATHPARYALVEVVNLHDDALTFEPIYRVLFNVEPEDVINSLQAYISELHGTADEQKILCTYANGEKALTVTSPEKQLTVATLQDFIDLYLSSHPEATSDYIHDEASLRGLANRPSSIGFLFDGMGKSQLFKTVLCDGALPRKTFSMGHARDKRYYTECRRISTDKQ